MPLQVVIGGMTRRPRVVDGRIEARDVLDLTITFDHAPASSTVSMDRASALNPASLSLVASRSAIPRGEPCAVA